MMSKDINNNQILEVKKTLKQKKINKDKNLSTGVGDINLQEENKIKKISKKKKSK